MQIFNNFNDMFNATCHFSQVHVSKIFDTSIYNGVADISKFLDIMNWGKSTQYFTEEDRKNDRSEYNITGLVIEHTKRKVLKEGNNFKKLFKALRNNVTKLEQQLLNTRILETGSLEEIGDFLNQAKSLLRKNTTIEKSAYQEHLDTINKCQETIAKINEIKEETWYEVANIYKKDTNGKPLYRDPWKYFYEKIMNITEPEEFTKVILTACKETLKVTEEQIDRDAVKKIKKVQKDGKPETEPTEKDVDHLIEDIVKYARWLSPMATSLKNHKFQWTPKEHWYRKNTPKEVEDCVNAIFGNTLAKAALHYMPRGYKDKYKYVESLTNRIKQSTNKDRHIYGKIKAGSNIVYWEFKCDIKDIENIFFSLHLKMYDKVEMEKYPDIRAENKRKIDRAEKAVKQAIDKINEDIDNNIFNDDKYSDNNLGKLCLLLDAVDNKKYIQIEIDDRYEKELKK